VRSNEAMYVPEDFLEKIKAKSVEGKPPKVGDIYSEGFWIRVVRHRTVIAIPDDVDLQGIKNKCWLHCHTMMYIQALSLSAMVDDEQVRRKSCSNIWRRIFWGS